MSIKRRFTCFIFALLCIVLVAVLSYLDLTNPYLWYDEAGQFWISMGLNHYSEPFSSRNGFDEVLHNNIRYNRDPGGFSVLLYIWMLISTNTLFIRVLPLLFFLIACIVLGLICYRETNNAYVSLLLFVLPFILPYVGIWTAQIRAYSMEICGTVVAVYLMMRLRQTPSIWMVAMLSLALSLACTSRYASIIAAFAISLRVLYFLYKQYGFKKMVPYSLVYAIPLIVTVGVVYFNQMRYQNADAGVIPYAQYIYSSPIVLIRPLSILFYILIALVFIVKKQKSQLSEISICALCVGSTFFIFSLANKYPWNEIRTMPATILICFSVIIELYKLLYRRLQYVNCILMVLFLIIAGTWLVAYDRIHQGVRINNEMEELIKLTQTEEYSTLFISLGLNPCVRHFYEYGNGRSMVDVVGYPEKMFLQVGPEHIISEENKQFKIVMPEQIDADFYMINPNEIISENRSDSFYSYNGFKYIYKRKINNK